MAKVILQPARNGVIKKVIDENYGGGKENFSIVDVYEQSEDNQNNIKEGTVEKQDTGIVKKAEDSSSTTTDLSTTGVFLLQLGAFSSQKNAQNLKNELENDGYKAVIKTETDLYKVQVRAESKEGAESKKEKLEKLGYNVFIIN